MQFLSAVWKDLLLANYVVDPGCLRPYVPAGTCLDPFDGKVFLSLVAFLFDDAKIVGLPIPAHRRFEEVNVRFYVTPEWDPTIRAVTFIQEVVPRRAIRVVANRLFHERYVSQPMSHEHRGREFRYCWGMELENRFSATVPCERALPEVGSVEEFITEHYVGYSSSKNHTLEYRVEHPQWECSEVEHFEIGVDFARCYGEHFAFLNEVDPYNVLYAVGSRVTATFPKRVYGR